MTAAEEPQPCSAVGTPAVCDFCFGPTPASCFFPAGAVHYAAAEGAAHWFPPDAWFACRRCRDFIERDRLPDLAAAVGHGGVPEVWAAFVRARSGPAKDFPLLSAPRN